ncbi:MAG: hypothetical protein FWD17_14860, partial [Polyangiaceae bacterium]|nr:hypothetical protein [Polyangiaceae bacterium]
MRRIEPTLIGIAVFVVHVALIVRAAMEHTGGSFGYAVDDAYIHLALAKHIAFDGVYGVTRYAFTAASSSVLWPWLLAGAMRVFGDRVELPLVINVWAGIAVVVVIGRALAREASMSPTAQTLVICAIVLLTPLATLAVVGMEHVLQAALTTAFVLEAADVVDRKATAREAWPVFAIAGALVATRYEGAFPVAIAAAILAFRGRIGLAAAIAAAGAAPIVLFGAYSVAHGSLFLPNSVLLKRQHLKLEELGDLRDVFGGVFYTLSFQSYLLPLALATCALLTAEFLRPGTWARNATRLALALGT